MQRQIRLLIFLIMAILLVLPVSARPVGVLDIPSAVRSSHLIVVGRITKLKFHSKGINEYADLQTAMLQVDRILKGTAAKKIEIRHGVSPSGPVPLNNGEYGMMFLRKDTGNIYTPVDPDYPILPAIKNRKKQQLPEESRVLQAVIAELSTDLHKQENKNGNARGANPFAESSLIEALRQARVSESKP